MSTPLQLWIPKMMLPGAARTAGTADKRVAAPLDGSNPARLSFKALRRDARSYIFFDGEAFSLMAPLNMDPKFPT